MDAPHNYLVTGGTAGIGQAVALRLAASGGRVLITGRDQARGEQTLRALRLSAPGLDHRYLPADLSLLAQTARLADAVEEASPRLDAVVCCAGLLAAQAEHTSEGLERTLVVNYLSRHLLARRLEPLLRTSTSGRLVLVANAGRYRDSLDLDDLQLRHGRRGLVVSARTQFANNLLATELHERWSPDVQVTCIYPGVVRTDVFAHARGLRPPTRALARLAGRLLGAPPSEAAMTPAFLASDPAAASLGGRFFGPQLREIPISARARARQRRTALWDASQAPVRPYLRPSQHPNTTHVRSHP